MLFFRRESMMNACVTGTIKGNFLTATAPCCAVRLTRCLVNNLINYFDHSSSLVEMFNFPRRNLIVNRSSQTIFIATNFSCLWLLSTFIQLKIFFIITGYYIVVIMQWIGKIKSQSDKKICSLRLLSTDTGGGSQPLIKNKCWILKNTIESHRENMVYIIIFGYQCNDAN